MNTFCIAFIYIAAPIAIILLYKRYKFFSKIGTVLMAYAVGIIMSVTGIMDVPDTQQGTLQGVQEWLMNLTVPLAIPLMLFSSHFALWFATLKKTVAALCSGLIAVTITVTLAYMLFRNSGLPDAWKTAGLLVAMYTGGTLNFASLSRILEVDNSTYILVQTFDTFLGFLLLLFVIGGGYRLFRKLLPATGSASADRDAEASAKNGGTQEAFEDYSGMFARGTFGRLCGALGLSVACLAVGAGAALLLTGSLSELVVILTITTLAIAASFVQRIRQIPKTFELGMYFILLFSVVIASQFDISSLFSHESLTLLGMIGFVLITSVLIHLLLARLFKVEGDLFTVSHIGLLFSPPFIPPVVAAMNNRKVLVSGIIIGLIGYACGTYLGTLMAELFHWIG